jgi:UDP:flavonoid glycosyltransferase YjiC (YdhE family)
MGPQHDQLTLADNMTGAEFLPQVSVLPHVDAVITHGGNNTITECLYFGKPMVVLPIFWDQHDNAQRMQETGVGIRLDTYRHEPEELTQALDEVLGGCERLEAIAQRLQRNPGTEKAAELIEACASR